MMSKVGRCTVYSCIAPPQAGPQPGIVTTGLSGLVHPELFPICLKLSGELGAFESDRVWIQIPLLLSLAGEFWISDLHSLCLHFMVEN